MQIHKYVKITFMNIAKVGEMWQFLQQRQVQQSALVQRPSFANIDSLTPLAQIGVKDVNVGITVHQQEAVGRRCNALKNL